MSEDVPRRVLVVTAHPDDVDFAAAGTVALFTAAGSDVCYLVCTDGDAGGYDRGLARSAIGPLRRAEQRAAAALVGVDAVEFLGFPDGALAPDRALRREIARAIRVAQPDLVVCPSPERDYRRIPASHPDHLAAGEATLCAVYPDARNPFAFPELFSVGLEPHAVAEVWLTGHPERNRTVDITSTLEVKLAAILSHESQFAEPAHIAARVRTLTAEAATRAGLPGGSYAEAFFEIQV